MTDERYWRERADAEHRMAAAAAIPKVRVIHETLRDASLRRAEAAKAPIDPAA